MRRHQQVLDRIHRFALIQCAEHFGGFQTDFLGCGQERKVGVQAAGLFVVVAGADLGDEGNTLLRFAGDQAELGVDFQPFNAIHHMTAGTFQQAGPLDVVFLIKAGFQLHQNIHLLAVFGGFHQCIHHLAVVGQTIKSHLDGDHVRVAGGLVQQLQEGTDALIRIVNQLVLFQDLRNDGLALVQCRAGLRVAGRKEQVGVAAQLILDLEQERVIQRRIVFKHPLGVQFQVFAQGLDNFFVDLTAQFQTDRCQLFALLDHFGHVIPVVQVFVIDQVGVNIRIAGDAGQRFAGDLIALVEQWQEVQDQFFRQDKAASTARHRHQPGEDLIAAGHNADLLLFCLGAQHRNRIDALVFQERKCLLFADDETGQQRQVVLPEQLFQFGTAFFLHMGKVQQTDPLLCKLFQQTIISSVPAGCQLVDKSQRCIDLFAAGHIRLIFPCVFVQQHLVLQAADAHHEKFIQIALENRQKTQPFTQRQTGILCLLQNAFVEPQPRKLTVCIAMIGVFHIPLLL